MMRAAAASPTFSSSVWAETGELMQKTTTHEYMLELSSLCMHKRLPIIGGFLFS